MTNKPYTTMLNAGVGMVDESLILMKLWNPGMQSVDLYQVALESGLFPNMTARRLKNLIKECFKPRYLAANDSPASLIKKVLPHFSKREINQLLFLFTCRESRELYDFVKEVYWSAYSAGKEQIIKDDALDFLVQATQNGKTAQPWSVGTLSRVANYLTNSCSDFGLLETGARAIRKIFPFTIEDPVFLILAYDLHFSGVGDNSVLSHPDWGLFGMEREDVLNELKRQALKGWFIIQTAGEATRIGWQYATMEEVTDVITRG